MRERRPRTPRGSGLALLFVGLLAACATASQTRSPWEAWQTLRLKAKGVPLFSGNVEMHVQREDGKCLLETTTTARFLGARVAQTRTRSVLDERTGRTQSYESVSKKRGRRYVFGKHGYRVQKLSPPRGPERPLDEWEVVSDTEYAYPTDDAGERQHVLDYYGMLLHLRRLALEDEGDEAQIHVATSRGPKQFRIVVGETQVGEESFVDPKDGATRTMNVRQLRLRIIPADPEDADEGFLEMEGETELWVEAESKTLLRVSGKIPKVPGRVRLVLTEMG